MTIAPDFTVPDRVTVTSLADGAGNDESVYSLRLRRDGWTRESAGRLVRNGDDVGMISRYDPPIRWVKHIAEEALSLTMELHGVGRPQGPWLLRRFTVHKGKRDVDLGECDWADVLPHGDVLFARAGAIYRIPRRSSPKEPLQLADLRSSTFEEVVAPEWARRW